MHRDLQHPNVLTFYDFTQDDTKVYFFLEYASYGDLLVYVREYQPAESEIASMMHQVGDALAYIHSCGVVHRDMKPENILVDQFRVPKITDFGYCDRVAEDGVNTVTPGRTRLGGEQPLRVWRGQQSA